MGYVLRQNIINNKMKIFHPYLTLTILFGMASFPAMAQNSIDVQIEYNYLHLPVSYEEEDHSKLELVIDGNVVRDFDIFLPDSEPDFWVFLDISEFKGKKASLRSVDGEEKKGFELVVDDLLVTYVTKQGYSEQFGARPMRRAIQDTVEEKIASKIIAGGLRPGSSIKFTEADLVG